MLSTPVSSRTGARRQACKDSYGCAYAPCIEKLSGQIFYADARHRAVDRAEAFAALDGLVHLALAHAVGEHAHRHVLRLGRLLFLDDRFNADAGIGRMRVTSASTPGRSSACMRR